MYLFFDENTEKKQLNDFKSTENYICFTFTEEVAIEDLSDISIFKMYSDDDIFLTEFILNNYKLVCVRNELYLKDKNKVVDLESAKNDKILKSKELLADWLASHPFLYSDGKYYSCTEEKQALLNGNLASYERATQANIPYPLKWNSTGEECTDWSYSDLVALSLSIAGYVAPKVSTQQAYELQIKACQSVDDVNEIVISYD